MNTKTIMTLAFAALLSQSIMAQTEYPKTAKDGTVDEYFGTRVADPYRWLENDTSEATARWVEAVTSCSNGLSKWPTTRR